MAAAKINSERRWTKVKMKLEQKRKIAKAKIVESITAWAKTLTEEAFDMADRDDPKVNWDDLTEIADHITGCLAMHAHGEIKEEVEEILADMEAAEARD